MPTLIRPRRGWRCEVCGRRAWFLVGVAEDGSMELACSEHAVGSCPPLPDFRKRGL